MTEFITWMQNNWYEFATILAEFAFLIAGVWFARKILKTLRASQEQFGALLKLTLTDELSERAKANVNAAAHQSTSSIEADLPTPYAMANANAAAHQPTSSIEAEQPTPYVMANAHATAHQSTSSIEAERTTPYVMAEWPAAAETPALTLPGGQRPRNPLAAAWRGTVRWLKAPIRSHPRQAPVRS